MTPSLEQINRLATDLRQANPKLSEAQAFARVIDAPEGQRLYRHPR